MEELSSTTKSLLDCGVIAVIRGKDEEEALRLAKAIAKGGIVGLEVTFTVPNAEKVIAKLIQEDLGDAIVGAGTVLDEKTAELAIASGARFIVGPNFDQGVCDTCKKRGIPYYPGVFTVTEIVHALKEGAEICKLFPGSLAGPSYVKAIHGPLPQARIMPTGGVDLDNVDAWIKSGVVAIGAGSNLTGVAKNGDYEALTELSARYVAKVQEARNAK